MEGKTKIKIVRESRGLSQRELARVSGVNLRMVQYYDQGAKDINRASAMTVYKLATALGVEVREILEG